MPNKKIQLSTVSFERVVVHTLPKHKKTDKDIVPQFSEQVSNLTPLLKTFFRDKILSSLNSDKAIKLIYQKSNTSPVPTLAKAIIGIKKDDKHKALIIDSKKIAQNLFDNQSGSNNEGILVIVPCEVNDRNALILIKLEMDSGAQLVLNSKSKSYDIREVEDLMLTKKTKIYKVAMLLNRTLQGVSFDAIVADHQIDTKAKDEIKSWFINKFLGCVPYEDPKVVTQHFYNFTKAYIDTIEDDIKRTKYHQDLNSYMLKNQTLISPKEFADDYLSTTPEKNKYKDHLNDKGVGFDGFQKDVSQIERRINNMTLEFANDIIITAKSGTLKDKVKLSKADNGQTKAEIVSRIRNVK
jgi:hypothetical protein